MAKPYTSYPRPVLWLVPEGELEWRRDGASRRVTVPPFYLSTLPVTNRQLEAFDGGRARAAASQGDDDPAIGVSREEAEAYCRWYGTVARKAIRLPSEAEWEHACRAGGEWPRGESDTDGAAIWHAGNSDWVSVPQLAAKPSNGFGLLGMLGGVWEWVAAEEGLPPVLRGGSWRTPLAEIAQGARRVESPGARPPEAGFRIAKSLRG
jgi:formylglycine-generating enzyme required for sulfatase activity